MKATNDADTGNLTTADVGEISETLLARPKVRADFAAQSHVGKVRKNNEDHYLVTRLSRLLEPALSNIPASSLPTLVEEQGYGMLVADGMGGAAAGEVASKMAVTFLFNLIIAAGKWGRRIDKQEAREIVRRAETYCAKINSALVNEGKADPALSGMGTTLTVAYSFCDELVIAHVGDSRAYLFRNGELHQLTHDHTLAQVLVDQGRLSPQAAARHRFRHVLTRVLGSRSGAPQVDIEHLRLEDRDRLLLCSDGLTDKLEVAAIHEVLASTADVRTACSRLIELALDAGGADNITAVLADYSIC